MNALFQIRKPALAIAVALAATPAAFAAEPLEAITVYGKINVSAESVSDSKTEFETKTDVVSNASRFGVKGGTAINDSLNAIYTVEWQVNVSDQSATGGKDNNISARNQYVGLGGGFGELVVGRNDTILKQSQGKVDLFNDLRGDLGNIFAGEVRSGDSLTYKSPSVGGFQAGATWVTESNGESVDSDGEATDGASLGGWYGDDSLKKQPFYAALAYDSQIKGYDTVRATAYGKLGPVQVGAVYQQQEAVTNGAESKDGYLVNAGWTINDVKLLAQFQTLDDKGDGWSAGGEYALGKPTKAYLFYTSRDLDALTDSEDYFGIGLDHRF